MPVISRTTPGPDASGESRCRTHGSTTTSKFKSQNPFSRRILAVNGRGREFPLPRGALRGVREVLAGAGGFQFCGGHVARGIYIHFHAHSNASLNRGARFFRHFRHHLLDHFAADHLPGRDFRRLRRLGIGAGRGIRDRGSAWYRRRRGFRGGGFRPCGFPALGSLRALRIGERRRSGSRFRAPIHEGDHSNEGNGGKCESNGRHGVAPM